MRQALAQGWWYGRYWVMVDEPTRSIRWFDTALEALLYLNGE